MAIDRIKRATFLCPVHATRRFMCMVQATESVEFDDVFEQFKDATDGLARHQASTEESDVALSRIHFILNLLDTFAPVKKGFVQGLAPVPLVVDEAEIEQAKRSLDLEASFRKASDLDDAYRNAERSLADSRAKLAEVLPFSDIPYMLGELESLKHVRVLFGRLAPAQLEALGRDPEAGALMAWEPIPVAAALRKDGDTTGKPDKKQKDCRGIFAFLRQDEETSRRLLSQYGFEEIPLPAVPGKVRDRIRELQGDIAEYHEHLQKTSELIRELAKWRRPLQVLKGFWENCRARSLAAKNGAEGKYVQVYTGYIRERDIPALEKVLKRNMCDVAYSFEEPAEDENVPVSITLNRFFRPVRMLVSMYGLPSYREFDPSPFIIFNFLLFFGICFGDVGYGLLLIGFSLYLMHKTRPYDGIHNFARLLLYGGVSTAVFGTIFGSWFGDLPDAKYLGEGNPILYVKDRLLVLDPLAKPVVMLVVALAIGMLNQFYGVILKMYGALRHRDWATAFFDAFLWLVILPGMVMMVGKMFAPVPDSLFHLGMLLFSIGAVGLVLSQGRGETTLLGKAMTGVVSIYGIMGSYGCTAFLGDTLSYCRLLALGLTTSIVAMTVNIMAGLLRETPYVGPVLFVALLVFGHLFNFAISLLGAFVHAMRLIFVEFFGRFYSGGAKPFRPLSMESPSFVIRRRSESS